MTIQLSTKLEYSEARIGIHEALERLGPATDKEMLGRWRALWVYRG